MSFSLKASSRLIMQIYNEGLKSLGIHIGQFAILQIVDANGPISVTRLAKEFEAHQTTMSRKIQPLLRDGLISVYLGEDARVRYVEITKKGRDTGAKAKRLWIEMQQEVEDAIGETRFSRLLDDLQILKERLAPSHD